MFLRSNTPKKETDSCSRFFNQLFSVQYEAMYRWSVEDPQSFWGSIAAQLHWERPWDKGQPICSYNFNLDKGPIYVKVCYLCNLDDG